MGERGLELSPEKTVITHIRDGFDFLGQNIRKYNDIVLIKPSKENTKRFLNNIREVIQKNPTITQEQLIGLNPKIRGWANYHRHINAKETCRLPYLSSHNGAIEGTQRKVNGGSTKSISITPEKGTGYLL
jgi:hypothetical protein